MQGRASAMAEEGDLSHTSLRARAQRLRWQALRCYTLHCVCQPPSFSTAQVFRHASIPL